MQAHEAQLRRLKQALNVESDTAFSQVLDVSQGSVSGAKKRGQIPHSWFFQVSEKTGCSVDWLFRGIGHMHPEEAPPAQAAEGFVGADVYGCDVDLIMIPRVAARLAAGTGSLETSGDVRGHYAFRSDWIHQKGNPKRMVLMDVIGDSMSPKIEHDDMVLVDQGKTDILNYGFFAVGVEDAVFIKQLRVKPGKLVLHSLNHDYEDIEVDMDAEHPQHVRIIGRVLWVGRELA